MWGSRSDKPRRRFKPAQSLLLRTALVWVPAAVLALWTIVFLSGSDLVTTLRNVAFDGFQEWHPRNSTSSVVQIIDIDDASLQSLGQWPWPRTVLADMVEKLIAAGAAVIALDIVFAEADRTSPAMLVARDPTASETSVGSLLDHDQLFADTIGRGPVVTGFFLSDTDTGTLPPRVAAGVVARGEQPLESVHGFKGSIKTLPIIESASRGNGALNFVPGEDGVIRRVPLLLKLGDVVYPTLAAEAVRVALDESGYKVTSGNAKDAKRFGEQEDSHLDIGSIEIATDADFGLWIHYSRQRQDRYTPAWKVLADETLAAEFENSIVLIGTSAIGLKDLRTTVLERAVPGVEIHAQIIEQVLEGSYLRRPSWTQTVELLCLFAAAILLVAMMHRQAAAWSALLATAMVAAGVALSIRAYASHQLLFDPLTPSLGLAGIFVAASIVRHIQTEHERSWIRAAFASYVSPNLVHHLIDHPDALSLGGEVRECSFVLSDLAGFTRLVESEPPETVVGLLNEYFAGMTDIVFRHDGTVEKIVGDALAVMFSAPVTQQDHSARAVACALELDRFCEEFSARKRSEGIPMGITRIGVHSGPVIVGNIGGSGQIDYRALGDPINTTSRLEAANKSLGTRMIVSEATVQACPTFDGRPVGRLALRGKRETVMVYQPLSPAEASSPLYKDYQAAYQLAEKRDPRAVTLFALLAEKAPDDPLIEYYMARLQAGEAGTVIDLAG